MNRTLLSAALFLGALGSAWGQSILTDEGYKASLSTSPRINYTAETHTYRGASAEATLSPAEQKKLLERASGSMYDSVDGEASRLSRVRNAIAPAQAVPEPGTMIALGAGAAIFFGRRMKKKAQ